VSPYITADEFVLTLPNAVSTITGSSRPMSIGDVATICERVSDELNGAAAAAGYAIPIPTTATQAYAQMALYNLYGAGCFTLRTIFPGGAPGGEMLLANDYCAQYQGVLAALMSGDLILPGAVTDPGQGNRELARSYSTSFPLATSGVVPQTEVGMRF
jgi:hypothetical protein